jgi:hypothetical protein
MRCRSGYRQGGAAASLVRSALESLSALLGVIAREINHPVVTALRQARSAGPADPSHHGISSIAAWHGRYVHQ